MTKIEETLKKIGSATHRAGTSTNPGDAGGEQTSQANLPGDPDCPICHGIGFVRQELPISHPDFGKLQPCDCLKSKVFQSVRHQLYRMSNLSNLQGLTFETFKTTGRGGLGGQQTISLERAYSSARQFASTLKGWLLLQGGYGSGKTHLAAAIANFTVSMGVPTLFITVPDLLDWMRFAYDSNETSFEDRFNEIRNVALLVMDDFGTQNATAWAQEKLFQIINHRYVNRLPLVVTSNLALEEIEGRIRSRLQDPELVTIVQILAPDFRNPVGDSGHPELSSLTLHHQRTFENFSLRQGEDLNPDDVKTLEAAYKAAQKFAEQPRGWIVFSGPYGCGKTHLAAAIGNYRASLGEPPMLVVVPDLLDHLRAAFNPNSSTTMDRRFDEVKTTPLLILDDLGTQSATPWAREKIYQLFNHRYNAELATVITTNQLSEALDPRILSRMQDQRLCKIVAITAPGFRGTPKPERGRAHRSKRPV
jgi:DNA replication protein DnaC